MSKYFAVRHEKIGFVISYFIPIAWIIMLWDSKKIRKGILIYLGTEILLIITGVVLPFPYGFIGLGFTAWIWWKYYSSCVKVLKSKKDLFTEQ